MAAIGTYLQMVYDESQVRGYRFDHRKIRRRDPAASIAETWNQLLFEWEHLKRKLARRDPDRLRQFESIPMPDPHPLFRLESGEVREWERGS